jgi:hypothetical protein
MRLTPWLLGLLAFAANAAAVPPCRIEVVEQGDGWPVPGVELRTVHGVRLVSDNAGLIACDLPELMGRETWFSVHGHGYGVKADGFGYRGVRLVPQPGKTLRVTVERAILARRLGRLTGAGLFAESQKLGEHLDWKESGVLGSDSVVTAELAGKLLWFWGDTNLAHYPLGIFDVSAATTERFLPPAKPPLRPPFAYVTEASRDGAAARPRGVAQVPGKGPTWLWGAVTLPDAQGAPHLVAIAQKVRPDMSAYRWDLVEWDAPAAVFRPLSTVWSADGARPKPPTLPEGHAVPWTDEAGRRWMLFGETFPKLRVPATYEAWRDPARWEPLAAPDGATTPQGEPIKAHRGHVAWHPWSGKWLALFTQKGGQPSFLGEIWLASAASPFGPWTDARKVLSHDDHTFYNPVLHPEFFRDDSPVIHFEGTYTTTFSGNKQPTPRWEYNQVLYQLDLSKPPFAAGK